MSNNNNQNDHHKRNKDLAAELSDIVEPHIEERQAYEEKSYQGKKPYYKKWQHSGLLPSAEELENYDSIVPGAAARIITMAEEEQEHRHLWEDNALRVYMRSSYYGMVFGTLIALFIVTLTFLLHRNGDKELAGFVFFLGFATLLWGYIAGRKIQHYLPYRKPGYSNPPRRGK